MVQHDRISMCVFNIHGCHGMIPVMIHYRDNPMYVWSKHVLRTRVHAYTCTYTCMRIGFGLHVQQSQYQQCRQRYRLVHTYCYCNENIRRGSLAQDIVLSCRFLFLCFLNFSLSFLVILCSKSPPNPICKTAAPMAAARCQPCTC